MPTPLTGAVGAAVALSLLLSSCGIIRDLTGGETGTDPQTTTEDQAATQDVTYPRLPFVRQARMSVEDGNDVQFELTVNRLQNNGEYLMLEVEHNFLEPLPGTVTGRNAPVRLVDPISGEVMRGLRDAENNNENYGTYFVLGDPFMPTHEGLPTTIRRYFPAPSQDVEYLSLTGAGVGHMPGIPLTYVDDFTQAPEPTADQYIDPDTFAQAPQLPEEIWYPDNVPEPGLDTSAYLQSIESFVDGPTASTTRSGDQETIALHSDNMFAVDEAEPTAEAQETIRQAAQSLRENLGPGVDEITIIGHTDGQGAADYNQTLSEQRAEAARALLEEELGSQFTFVTQGRGATALLAQEGGADDQQARARNRRVEFAYQVPLDDTDTSQRPQGLDSARRHVGPPAPYFDNPEPFTTVSHNDVDLHVYPMVRDGAYLVQMVGFQNSTPRELEADLDADEAVIPGSPAQYTEGTMGGFRLEDPDTGIIRYVVRIHLLDGSYEDFADQINTLAPGEQYFAIAVFPAPALDATEMTLYAGAFGQVAGVPIH
ncbi:OmpA family protein [Nocardiopsis sp. YSL2]|uniref:OmpA family protein n=1 Tax=Nocardiopsis sp. YSL2 TaxID=2939492 RepID=UPI0026F454C4|nr:OmpA family protein [Nocardiopsis sp. YSL2]